MYLHAFAIHRSAFDYYIFSEVDYVPVHANFAGILARLYDATFEGRAGMLVGVLQGAPVERGNMPPHPHTTNAWRLLPTNHRDAARRRRLLKRQHRHGMHPPTGHAQRWRPATKQSNQSRREHNNTGRL